MQVDEMTEYEIERMNNCLSNNEIMRGLGLPVVHNPFANISSLEKQGTRDSGSQYNGEEEPNSDDHSSDDNLEPEISSQTTKKVTKRGGRKAQPHNQASVLTRSNAKKATAPEISIQTTEEADAAQQNACQTEGEDNIQMETIQDGDTENYMDLADDPFDDEDWVRGRNIGRQLDRMTRSRKGKLPLVIEPGKIRPNSVMIAAKFATECNIAVRNHVPIFTHWKEYKKLENKKSILAYIKRVCSKFQTDVTATPVRKACVAMMKKAVRQQRYKLKKVYFDARPLHLVPKASPVTSMNDDQWNTLVANWKTESKMLVCETNKGNRGNVQFHQTTGSRSYEMHLIDLANKYQNEQPNALDIFKDCHYNKKKGFTPAVQSAIVEMEDKINAPVNDGEEPKDVTDAVSEVLLQKTKKNSFLVNVGMKSSSVSGDNAESLQELEAELVVEKQTSSELRELVKTQQVQMEDMMKKFEESEATKARQNEEFMKKQAETDALIRSLMSMIPASVLTR
ncbi:unnamed protein product [Urochloa humidicola]